MARLLRKSKLIFLLILLISRITDAQSNAPLDNTIRKSIERATRYFDENLSVDGGYVWTYSQDLTRRWGELEARPNIIWVQGPGTVRMGHTFLDIYEKLNDPYYLNLALKAGLALAKGQMECGGWNYFINFDDEASTKEWYNTIGKNAWRFEEFHHYYGNATFDDNTTTGAADFLLRLTFFTDNEVIKSSLEKAIRFIVDSQYEIGGWPQRFPIKDKFEKEGNPDYTSFLTFNDGVNLDNTIFLIKLYFVLDDSSFIEPIKRAIEFIKISQQPNPQAGWAMQYNLELQPEGARTYEPKALCPGYTLQNVNALINFFELTGDSSLIKRIPDAFIWLKSVRVSSEDNYFLVPTFVELETNKTLYLHRIGSNVKYGKYYYDYDNEKLIKHYNSLRIIGFDHVFQKYQKLSEMHFSDNRGYLFLESLNDLTAPQKYQHINSFFSFDYYTTDWKMPEDFIKKIVTEQDEKGRWLTRNAFISYPYTGEPESGDDSTNDITTTMVGDKYDTSTFENTADEKFISTALFIRNIKLLLQFLSQN